MSEAASEGTANLGKGANGQAHEGIDWCLEVHVAGKMAGQIGRVSTGSVSLKNRIAALEAAAAACLIERCRLAGDAHLWDDMTLREYAEMLAADAELAALAEPGQTPPGRPPAPEG